MSHIIEVGLRPEIIDQERTYWEKNLKQSNEANERFFQWYDRLRLKHFGIQNGRCSLEIGPGKGYFAKIAGLNFVIDVTDSAFEEIRKCNCRTFLGSASQLPFDDGYFDAVYAIDVLHHLKAEGILGKSCAEIKRVLKDNGVLCVSDRLPTSLNSIVLFMNRYVRCILLAAMKLLNKKVLFSGSDNEPPMTEDDYAVIFKDMDIVVEKKWKTWIVPFLYGFQQFINLLLPYRIQVRIADSLIRICDYVEDNVSDSFKMDTCLVLKAKKCDSIML